MYNAAYSPPTPRIQSVQSGLRLVSNFIPGPRTYNANPLFDLTVRVFCALARGTPQDFKASPAVAGPRVGEKVPPTQKPAPGSTDAATPKGFLSVAPRYSF